MFELEEIYLNPRVDQKDQSEVTNQIKDIRHIVNVPSQSLLNSSHSGYAMSANLNNRK